MAQTIDPGARHPFEIEFLRRLADVAVLTAAAHVASYARFGAALDTTAPIHTVLLYFCCALAFFIFPQFGMYASWRERFLPFMLGRLAVSWAVVILLGLLFSFTVYRTGDLSRLWLLYWYVTGVIFMAQYRA